MSPLRDGSYSGNDLLNALLVTLHLQERPDLAQCEVLPIPQSDQFVEGAKQIVGIPHDLPFVEALASAGDDLCE